MGYFVRGFSSVFVMAILLLSLRLTFGPDFVAANGGSRKPKAISNMERQIAEQIRLGNEADFELINSKIMELLRKDPLNDNALVFFGQSLQLGNKEKEFDPYIFEVVSARNPRNRKNLYGMLQYYLRIADYGKALEAIDILYRLDSSRRDEILMLIVTLYDLGYGYSAINAALTNRPVWELDFLEFQTRNKTNIDLSKFDTTLKISIRLSEDISLIQAYVRRFLYNLIKADRVEVAYKLWKTATNKAEMQNGDFSNFSSDTINYNPFFRDVYSPAPFNWTFFSSDDTFIESDIDGVRISYGGSEPKLVAMQYFVPQSGAINLIVKSQYRTNVRRGGYSIKLRCLSPKQAEFVIILESTTSSAFDIRKTFNGFEAGCKIASLELLAKPKMFENSLVATFSYVGLKWQGSGL